MFSLWYQFTNYQVTIKFFHVRADMATKPRHEFPMAQVSWSLGTLALQQHPVQPPPHSKQSAEPPYEIQLFTSRIFRNFFEILSSQSLSSLLKILLRQSGRSIETYGPASRYQMDQCKRILKLPGEYAIWSHLGSSQNAMDRQAAANVAAAVTPPASHLKPNTRWRRYNPMSKLGWRKSKAPAIPHVHGYKVKSVRPAATRAAKLNYVNPLYYIRRIKNNLTNSNRQRTPA